MSTPMQVAFASSPSPTSQLNEDHIVAVPELVCILDGVSVPEGIETGCRHDTHWYVQHLGARLLSAHAADPGAPLPQLLAAAIAAVGTDHGGICDLDNPATPSSTAVILRVDANRADWLVLCDSSLVLDRSGSIEVVTDLRLQDFNKEERRRVLSHGGLGTDEHAGNVLALARSQLEFRNREGGFWLAASNVKAASHALTGSAPLVGSSRVTRAALLSDGAASIVEPFGELEWTALLDELDRWGPANLIHRVRQAEATDRNGANPRPKRHDDASVAFCRFPS